MFGLSFVLFILKMSPGNDFVFDLVDSKSFENRLCNFLCFQVNVYLSGDLSDADLKISLAICSDSCKNHTMTISHS